MEFWGGVGQGEKESLESGAERWSKSVSRSVSQLGDRAEGEGDEEGKQSATGLDKSSLSFVRAAS